MKQRLEYKDEKSNKFWEVEVIDKEMVVRYGKIDTEGQVSVKQFASMSEAETAAGKAVAEKIKKGYVEIKKPNPRSKKSSNTKISEKKIEDLNEFVNLAMSIPEQDIFTMLFVDQNSLDEDENPLIRALFCYARKGNQIVFNAVGLTDSSRGVPYQHYGLINLIFPVEVWRFEEIGKNCFLSEISVARSTSNYVYDFDQEDNEDIEEIKADKKLIKLCHAVEEKTFDYYFIAESDEGEYRLNPDKRHSLSGGCWIQDGFVPSVYQVARSILRTADGFVF
jgi:predicted DNA-binding WGR domain protein